jgi:hypothetical protein
MMREPTGVGLEIPAWLVMIEEEVDRVVHQHMHMPQVQRLERAVPSILVPLEDIRRQLQQATTQNRNLRAPGNKS